MAGTEQPFDVFDARQDVTKLLEVLSPIDREIVLLRHFEARSWEEIAQILGWNAVALRSRYSRLLGRLHKQWRQLTPQ